MKRAIFFAATGAAALLFVYTIHLAFYVAPLDSALYFNQKIFYYHVANAFVLFVAVFACGIPSALYLFKREPRYDDIAAAAGELAILFGATTMTSGPIWGKAAWGVWWQWDARLTFSLLLWMVMIGYMLVRRYGGPGADRLAAGLAVFATANVPLVYFSVQIWRTLHPQTSVVPGLQGGMKVAFWLSVLVFQIVFGLLFAARIGQLRDLRKLRETREAALDAGILE